MLKVLGVETDKKMIGSLKRISTMEDDIVSVESPIAPSEPSQRTNTIVTYIPSEGYIVLYEDLEIILSKIEALESLEIEMKVDDPEIESISIHLFSKEEFEEGQLGYRIDEDGNSLIGENMGDWKENWYVIGYDELVGDPIFIDINNKQYPVLTAMHGEGDWEPEVMFSSLNEFLESHYN